MKTKKPRKYSDKKTRKLDRKIEKPGKLIRTENWENFTKEKFWIFLFVLVGYSDGPSFILSGFTRKKSSVRSNKYWTISPPYRWFLSYYAIACPLMFIPSSCFLAYVNNPPLDEFCFTHNARKSIYRRIKKQPLANKLFEPKESIGRA